MADLGKFLGGVFGSAASAANPLTPAQGILQAADHILGYIKMSPEAKAQLQAQLTEANIDLEKAQLAAQVAAMQGQLDIDKQEAASTSIWVAGWRPFIGWICGVALGWEFVLKPFLVFGLIAIHHPPITPIPALDTATLIAGLLAPLLGLGTMRSVDKYNGTPDAAKIQ